MDVGVLAQVERREMEAEDLDGTTEAAQTATRHQCGAVTAQRGVDDAELGGELGTVRIRRRGGDGMTQCLQVVEFSRCRGQPRVDAGNGAPVGLVVTVRIAVR